LVAATAVTLGRSTMSLLDKIKGLIRGNKKTIKQGIDEVDKFAKDKLRQHLELASPQGPRLRTRHRG